MTTDEELEAALDVISTRRLAEYFATGGTFGPRFDKLLTEIQEAKSKALSAVRASKTNRLFGSHH
jgi:thiamine pyrophosphokinase